MTPPANKKIGLDDLTPEAREQLVSAVAAELRKSPLSPGGVHVSDADLERAKRRDERIKALLKERDHLEGCPVAETGTGRVETYGSVIPANPDIARPAEPVTVVRCIDCGGSKVVRRPYDVVRAELDAEQDVSEPDTEVIEA